MPFEDFNAKSKGAGGDSVSPLPKMSDYFGKSPRFPQGADSLVPPGKFPGLESKPGSTPGGIPRMEILPGKAPGAGAKAEIAPSKPLTPPPKAETLPSKAPGSFVKPEAKKDTPAKVSAAKAESLNVPPSAAEEEQIKVRTLMGNHYMETAGITGAAAGGLKVYLDHKIPLNFPPGKGLVTGAEFAVAKAEAGAVLKQEVLNGMAKGVGKGMAVAGASLLAGYALDRVFGADDNKVYGASKLFVDGIVAPGILMSSLPLPMKAAAAGVAVTGVRVANYFNSAKTPHNDKDDPVVKQSLIARPDGTFSVDNSKWELRCRRGQAKVEMSSLLVPNHVDAVLLPAAVIALPSRFKVAGAAGAFAIGRVCNYLGDSKQGDGLSLPKHKR